MDIDAAIDGIPGEIKSVISSKRNSIERSCVSVVSKFENIGIEPPYLILNTTYVNSSLSDEYWQLVETEKKMRGVEKITVILKDGSTFEI